VCPGVPEGKKNAAKALKKQEDMLLKRKKLHKNL